jgi:membrane associated rhomboid family serine protease
MPSLPPATQALLLANVAVFFLERLVGSALFGPLALWPIGSGNFFPWQVLSYSFLHGSFEHLFFNMLGLWMFGSELEQVWGQKRYVQFYTASVLAAALTQLVVSAVLGSVAPTIGASGGLFGLLLAFAMIFPNRIILLFFVIPMRAKWLVALYGVLELYQGVYVMNSGVAHFAHLGGMAGGLLTIRYWRRQPPFGRR